MKSKAFFVLIILLPLCLNGGSVEKQIIVLFQPDVIGLPIGQRSAQLPEITAPQHVIECLQAIGAIMIARGLPDFEPDDTIRITQDGWVARLPNWAHLFVIELPAGTNRDSAVIIMENLDEVIYAEKNRRGEFFQTEPNDTYFKWYQRNLNDSTGNTGIDVMRAWDLSRGSNTIKIGIIDTGVDTLHPDLKNRGFTGGPPTQYGNDHG